MSTGQLDRDQLDRILEEIGAYSIDIEPDPTQPDLGAKYLQRVLSDCRKYQNRVQHYYQLTKTHLKNVRLEIQLVESDIEIKMAEKLADDMLVRQQPSIEDRKALAITQLAEEHRNISRLRILKLDLEESSKIIKMKYDQLRQTSNDIRTQRQIVKDDKEFQLGGTSYSRPASSQNRIAENNLPPPIGETIINPTDLLDPNKRPEGIPVPVDAGHAALMADFLNGSNRRPVEDKPTIENMNNFDYNDIIS